MAARNSAGVFLPEVGEPEHDCSACGERKVRSCFYRSRGRSGYTDRPQAKCIVCLNKRQKAYHKKKYPADPVYRAKIRASARRSELRRNFGITEEEYDSMLTTQGGCCRICAATTNHHARGKPCRLAVDHDHKTGRVRGLLCTRCNQLIGSAGDSVEILAAAIKYLTAESEPHS